MALKWFKRILAIGGAAAVIVLFSLFLSSRTNDVIIAGMAGLVVFVIALETHLRQVVRDQNARLIHR